MNKDLAHTNFGTISIFLKNINGGVEMTDIVHYKLPLGLLGNIAHKVFVKEN